MTSLERWRSTLPLDLGQMYTVSDYNRSLWDVSVLNSCLAYENGTPSLLLHLVGTLPVSFRGNSYNIPIDTWIPSTYPLEAPIVYVTPTPDMVVRSGQHVTLEGRVYHHYLAHWHETWDVSQIKEACSYGNVADSSSDPR